MVSKDYFKKYYQENKDTYFKKYYQDHKEDYLKRNYEKVECEICGITTTKHNLSQHRKTKKHIRNMEKKI